MIDGGSPEFVDGDQRVLQLLAESVEVLETQNFRLALHGQDRELGWRSLMLGGMANSPTAQQAQTLAYGLRGFEPSGDRGARRRLYELADVDAHALTILDNVVDPDNTPLDTKLFINSFQAYLFPDFRRGEPADENSLDGIRQQRRIDGMDRPPRLLWLAMRLSVYLNHLNSHSTEDKYSSFAPIAEGAGWLELDEETVFRTVDIFAAERPAKVLQMLATSEHAAVERWAARPQTPELLRGAIESADEKQAAEISKVTENLLAYYVAKGPTDGAGAKWPRLARRLNLAEADACIPPETQRQLAASAWFDMQVADKISAGSRRRAAAWLSSEELTIIGWEGKAAAKLYGQELAAYNAALERHKQENFPETLRARSRDTEIVLLTLMAPLTPESGNADLAALMRACTGEGYTFIRDRQPALAELLKAHNISVRNIADEHYGVVKETQLRRLLKVDEYDADTVVALFGLAEAADTAAEMVVTIDRWDGQGEKALAEAVHRLTGKYPHFAYVPWFEPGEGTPYWKVKEFVPIPPEPVKKRLANVLAQAALSA